MSLQINETIFTFNLTGEGSEFHRVGAANEKCRFQLISSHEECKEGYYWFAVEILDFLLE